MCTCLCVFLSKFPGNSQGRCPEKFPFQETRKFPLRSLHATELLYQIVRSFLKNFSPRIPHRSQLNTQGPRQKAKVHELAPAQDWRLLLAEWRWNWKMGTEIRANNQARSSLCVQRAAECKDPLLRLIPYANEHTSKSNKTYYRSFRFNFAAIVWIFFLPVFSRERTLVIGLDVWKRHFSRAGVPSCDVNMHPWQVRR